MLLKIESDIYDYSKIISCVTNGLMEHINQKTRTQTYLFYNGIDSRRFLKLNEVKNKNFTLLFHGTLGRFQDIELLLKYDNFLIENKVSDIKIIIIGSGPKSKIIEKHISEKSNITYLGHKKNVEIPLFISKSHVGVSPRIKGHISKTSFPVKIFEYMSQGLPIVSFPYTEAGEFLEQNNIGIQLDNNEIDNFHNYILKLKNNPSLYKIISENAVKLSKNFDRNKLSQAYFDNIYT